MDLECDENCSTKMKGRCCLKYNQNKFNNQDEGNHAYHHRTSKVFSQDRQRKLSSKRKIDHTEQNSNLAKSNIDDLNENIERNYSKRTSRNPFLMQQSRNFSQKDKRESNVSQQNQKQVLKKKSSLDNMINKSKPNKKNLEKEVEVLDHTYQYSHLPNNRVDQSNSFSSIYDKNCKNKKSLIRYRTTSPGLKDGTISIDQSKSKQVFVSSAGQIPSAVTHTLYSGQSLPKSHKNIGKKPLLNLSEIKGLKFSEKFKQFNKKIPSKKQIPNRGYSLSSKLKLELDDINSQNGKRNAIAQNQAPQIKTKNQPSSREFDSQNVLSPSNVSGTFQEDIKNQFSTKNVQNSSARLLYNQINEQNNQHFIGNVTYPNLEQKNLIQANQGQIGERQNFIGNNATNKRQLQDHSQPKLIESDTESMQYLNNGGGGYLKEFYGMFFQILSEGIILFNFENGDININYTLKRLLNCHNDKECVEILFSLKNASLQPLNHSTEGHKSQNLNDDGVTGQNSNNPEINHFNSSFMNINSYMYDNSLFTASKNKTYEEQTTSNNYKLPTQKSQKSINIHSNYTYQNQITNSNNLNDDVLSQIKRRHSTSSYHKTNTLMSRKTTRFQYKKDEDELNSSAEVENSPAQQQTKIKVNSGIFSSNIIGFQLQLDGVQNNSSLQNNNFVREIEMPQKNTVKLNNKTNQAQKQPDSGLQIDESLNQENIGSNNIFDRSQFQQQFQQIQQSTYQNDNQIEREEEEFKPKRKDVLGSGMTATASPQQQQQQLTYHHTQTHSHNSKQTTNKPFKKIIYSVAKEFTVKDQLEKIEEDMHDYTNESNYEMLGHHIKMLCKLECKNQKQSNYETQATASNPQNTNTPGQIQNINQQPNYYHSQISQNQISSLNAFQHQNSAFIDGLKNRKTSRFSNLSALNPFQQQSTVQFIQQQIQQQQQLLTQSQHQNKAEDKKIIEITFIPCYVNKQKCLVLVVKDVSHFNSIKVLKEMNENRSKMLNYVVHEIRSPLSSIMNYLHSSVESLTKELYDQFIDPALSSAQMLNVLIQDLLDMAQMKAGKYRLNIRPFRIENLIEDVKRTMRVIVKQKSQDINLESYIDPLITNDISSDQLRIKQILINLISNAVKFTEEGSIRIEVHMVENRIYRFSVRDTGIGITDDQKKKLFSEFSKIETTQTDILNPKGVGLGLVISNILAKSLAPKHMQAGLEITSGKSKGSEFFFHILDFTTQNNNNNTTIFGNQSSILNSEQNIQTRTAKMNGTQQTKLNNLNFVNPNNNSNTNCQMSPTNKQIGMQQFQMLKTNTQIINSLFPYTKGGSSDAVLDQEFYLQDQEQNGNNNNINNKKNCSNQSSSSPSSNSSSSPSSRKNSASVPIDEEDIDINIQYISPKFRRSKYEQGVVPNLQQQQVNMQFRYLSSSVAAGSDYVKNAEMSGQNNSQSNHFNNNNNYSFIQNSLPKDPNKAQSLNYSQNQPNQQNNTQLQQVASSYFNFEDNNQQGTASLPINSVQSLRFGFQSLQHNSQPSSSLQQDGLLNIPPNFDLKNKHKKKCNCSNILIVDDETFQCNSLSQLIFAITKQQCDKATGCDSCMKQIITKHQQNQCCPSYQLILLDLNMFPSKDGFETLLEIQKYHQQVRLQMPKVVACTGEADEEKKQQCLFAGFVDILEKPTQVDSLKQILNSYYFMNQVQQQPQQYVFQNTMSQLSFNQQLQVINM